MGRRWTAALATGGVLVAGLALAGDARPPLRAQLWLSPEADAVAALTRTPTECLALPANPQTRLSIEIGRAAFRTPTVLGGQAARAGLSCESCHRAGRNNPDFVFPGVSGAPGTADVTSSLFSTHRGDGLADPRPIPDLSGPKGSLKIPQAPATLSPFIHGLITEEFDGPEPPTAVLSGLVAYVSALGPSACPAATAEAVNPGALMADARRALLAAEALSAQVDAAATLVMIAGARARLGLIDERFARQVPHQKALRRADTRLADLAQGVREGRPQVAAGLTRWRQDSHPLEAVLARHAQRSLFDPTELASRLQRRLPREPS